MSKTLRWVLVISLGIVEFVLFLGLLLDYDQAVGQYGFTVGEDGVTIVTVQPKLPAALAGIQAGDRIVYQTLPLIGRRYLTLQEPVPANAPLTMQYTHAGNLQTVTLNAQLIPGSFIQIQTITYAVAGFIFALIGLGLVLLRPSRMTWAFAFIAPPMLLPWRFLFWAQHSDNNFAATYDIFVSIIYALQIIGILIFASRFPNDKPRGLSYWVDRLSIPLGIIIGVIDLTVALKVRFTTISLPHWRMLSNYEIWVPGVIALIALFSTYITTSGSDRSRLAPVIGSFIFLILMSAMQQILPSLTSSNGWLFTVNLANAIAPALVAMAVAYGVIRHRVMDVSFIIERTLAYSIITLFIIVGFSVVEYFVDKLLERGRLAEMVEMFGAVFIGLSITYVHSKLESFLDLLFFRRRYVAEKRINKTANTLPHASTLELIDEMLVIEPSDALGLASAAVFRRAEDDSYVRVESLGWDEKTVSRLDHDDHLIVRLRAELQSINVADVRWPCQALPSGSAFPTFVIPVLIGYQLEAVLLYGGHSTGEDIDPDERKILCGLANSAALAYGHLIQQQLHKNLENLKVENLTLLKVEQKLEEILKSQLNNRPSSI